MPIRRLHVIAGSVLLALVLASAVSAQPMQSKSGLELSARWEFFPFVGLSDPAAGTFEEDATIFVNDFYADAAWHGLKLGPRTTVVPRFSYQVLGLTYDDWVPTEVGPDIFTAKRVFALKLHAGIRHQFTSDWSFTGELSPGLVSDYREVDSDHWKIDGLALFNRRQNSDLTYGFGAVFSRRFGEPLVLPALKLRYQVNEDSYFDVLAPRSAEYWNQTWEYADFGIGIWFTGEEYFRGKEIEASPELQPKGNSIRYSVGTVGPMGRYTLPNGWEVTGSLGLAFLRRLEEYNEESDVTREFDLKESLFFRISARVM